MTPRWFFSVALFGALFFVPAASRAEAVGPLIRSSNNPNYFAKPDGTPVYLTGSHQWTNLQDGAATFPPAGIDYTAYVNWMQNNQFNFIRMWVSAEQPYSGLGGKAVWYNDPLPYTRPGPGVAADGKAKFNISSLNQKYFDRLRARVIAAGQRGVYVSIMLFEGFSLDPKGSSVNPWTYHPFNVKNNINNINGDPLNTGIGDTIETTSEPAAVLSAQQAYIRKVIDTVNDLDNVLYEITNEGNTSSVQWQYNMINYLKSYQAEKPKRHPVGMTIPWCPGCIQNNADLFNSPADWISPFGDAYKTNPPVNDGSKVILSDTDHLWGGGGDSVWVWKSFMRGLNPIFMDDLGQTGINLGGNTPFFDPAWYAVRTGMTQTARYAARLDLKNAKPNGNLSSTGYMLANPGTQYLAFAPSGGGFTINLSAGSGNNFSVEWFNVSTGAVTTSNPVSGGSSNQSFAQPFTGPAVLFLY
jgi:hypothetical protein